MSIQSEITRLRGNVSDALSAIADKGVTVPSGSNSDDLANLISQITGGGDVNITQDANGYIVLDDASPGGGGGGGLTAKTGTYTFASDYTVTKANAVSWAEGAVVIATGLTDLKCISFISEEVLNRSGTPARPFVGAGIWMRGSDPTNTNYLNNSKGIDGGQTVGSSNWNGTNIYGSKVISTHEMNPDNCPAGSFALFAYSGAYYFKAGQKIIWEAIGTE